MNNDSWLVFRTLNKLWYLYRRNSWMLDILRLFREYKSIDIERPIFLLGNQGDGLTLVSRMLRRNKQVVSATGDCEYWAGADELQNVMGLILPPELTGTKHKAPPHPTLTPPRSWSYASDPLIKRYRSTEADCTLEMKNKFRRVLKYLIARYGRGEKVRFVDKSQVYTVKVSLIDALLEGCNPKFVLITRSPYISCPRAATGKAGDMKRYSSFLSWKERLELCAQHWTNSIEAVFEDQSRLGIFVLAEKIEEILNSPEETLRRICDFVELDYDEDMVPQLHHKIPFGSRYRDRWYPIRLNANRRYWEVIRKGDLEIIENKCGKFAKVLGYERPF